MSKTIISCAVTGGIHTPTMSDALPVTPSEIGTSAREAAEAGAAILHLHARVPDTGEPSGDPAHFQTYLPQLKQGTNAVLNITTGGSPSMTVAERLRAAETFAPEMCSLNMGSINFALHKLADRYTDWKHDWEKPFLESTEANIFRNTFEDLREVTTRLNPLGIKYEHEVYDLGHLYNLQYCIGEGYVQGPVFVQFVMGIMGGIGADIENLVILKKTADKLLGDNYEFSVVGAGAQQMKLAAVCAQMGGHVRVGLEDSLYIARRQLAESNAQQVEKIREILTLQGNDIATPDEAREILGLKGADRTNIR